MSETCARLDWFLNPYNNALAIAYQNASSWWQLFECQSLLWWMCSVCGMVWTVWQTRAMWGALLCRCILGCLGMHVLEDTKVRLQKYIRNKERLVCIFPHTSCWDTFYLIIFSKAYNLPSAGIAHACWEHTPVIGTLLRWAGLVFVHPRIDGGSGGATQQIIDHLRPRMNEGFMFWISPTGGRVCRPWRSGYLHVARALDARIVVIGIDYLFRDFVITTQDPWPVRGVVDEVVPMYLRMDWDEITPLHMDLSYPRCLFVDFSERCQAMLTPFDYQRVLLLLTLCMWGLCECFGAFTHADHA
jgi:1-acyl-sn-glycerol-3-phosphate acyltransferase